MLTYDERLMFRGNNYRRRSVTPKRESPVDDGKTAEERKRGTYRQLLGWDERQAV
tara:strand:- start:546 stop:710 length:165 start_codon:yes stop_codon:yes gene_type:complete